MVPNLTVIHLHFTVIINAEGLLGKGFMAMGTAVTGNLAEGLCDVVTVLFTHKLVILGGIMILTVRIGTELWFEH